VKELEALQRRSRRDFPEPTSSSNNAGTCDHDSIFTREGESLEEMNTEIEINMIGADSQCLTKFAVP